MTERIESSESIESSGLSEALKKARLQKKLSLVQVSETLKVAERHLAAFENEPLNLTVLTPFQRGYLRNYAELLEVSLQPYEADLQGQPELESSLKTIGQQPSQLMKLTNTKILLSLLIGVIAVLIIYSLLSGI
ncbi:helix-turn-helix domain-containing protein [Thiosulfativibrio zosterae]|uniref:HTH cro/C1-type domain-containing protein n=1 Tax=Thiosulfativibrio zosterae TaxID=2675053 RepID=A0A6F8PLJ3_9GAMM|nr:helix-turn-helix transcriptional regulator [Thiosulfativibrio zosterae]BBP42972.1 hypothetical protein THMIRHAT_07180 [Thiosulfativibrio zosterae]